jgi:hypothetical protein
MNVAESVDAAVDCGYDIVCSPRVFNAIWDRARKRESNRNTESLDAGRGPSMRRPIDIEWHEKQESPVMLAFDDWRAFRAHLVALNA